MVEPFRLSLVQNNRQTTDWMLVQGFSRIRQAKTPAVRVLRIPGRTGSRASVARCRVELRDDPSCSVVRDVQGAVPDMRWLLESVREARGDSFNKKLDNPFTVGREQPLPAGEAVQSHRPDSSRLARELEYYQHLGRREVHTLGERIALVSQGQGIPGLSPVAPRGRVTCDP
ncbi:hypothetical protein PTTG_29247 [Puccinia triticina 1-1 BBBD Race 1]|uniref:Uncharacterized protein n=2 Tax=Puccinia triticina TaxID=208348 RepID=A0A180G5L5_PUCT1|nr:uncharacterized protein PtA15_17A61 [Puccinia triticina]OAV87884.1 hypothetical protein PTTG_29247 [Puccinia triticina 1-1 BBBD Race 1]WAQ92580.1 hypothetical protein PtA15_17A61 [Puccinia triticina]